MPAVLIVLLLLPPAFSLAALLKQSFEQTISLVLLGLMGLGYGGSLFGLVWLMPYVLYAACLAACVHLVVAVFVRRQVKLRAFLSLGLPVFIVLAALMWWMCRGRMLTFWDDFSHWGLAVKNMYYLDDLYTVSGTSATFLDYPPGAPLLQYILMKAARLPYREDVALFINGLLCASLAVYPVKAFGWKKPLAGIASALLLFLVPAGITSGMYQRLLVDGLIGLLFVYVVLAHFLQKDTAGSLPAVLLGCFALAVVKAAGVGLAAMAGILILLDVLVISRKKRGVRATRQGRLCIWLQALAPLVATLLAQVSWKIYLAVMQIGSSKPGLATGAEIWAFFTGRGEEYRYRTAANFFRNFFTQPGNGNWFRFPSAVWFVFYALLFAATMLLLQKGQRRRYVFTSVGMVVAHLVFLLGTLWGYLFHFSVGEAEGLAAFFRYEATVSTACLLYFIVMLLAAAAARHWAVQLGAVVGSVCLSLAVCINTPWLVNDIADAPMQAAHTKNSRVLSLQSAERVQRLGEAQPRLYLVSIIDDQAALMHLVYEILPITLAEPEYLTSIATGYYYGENTAVGSEIYSPEEWGQVLAEGFDYVYLYNIDGYFATNYRSLFENADDIVNDTMLQVVRHADGGVSLRKLF